ncbi:MAG: insulinase family protein [Clostridia bacterium]|nr:insulinase family protein [Clostridia bacterium]
MNKITTLKNGLRIITEVMPGAQSVFVGVWVKAGSTNERDSEWGISHFIEHMVFKGTEKRTAQQISEETDYVGGQANAFTSRDCTCYYSRTLPNHMELSFDILSDIYHNPRLSKKDIDLERGVIKEEIMMYEDCPEDLVQDRLLAACYPGSAIGREIAGSLDSVDLLDRNKMLDYMARYYTPDNTVITVCGKFDEAEAIRLCEKYFSKRIATFSGDRIIVPTFTPVEEKWEKDIEQAHLCLSYPSVALKDDKLSYTLSALSNIFGGSMSSRLFSKVREERGLCYSVYSYSSQTEVSGLFSIYTGLNASCLDAAEEVIHKCIKDLLTDGITDYELTKGKEQLKAAILMDMENPSSRMSALGKDLLIYNEVKPVEAIVKDIDSVTKKDIEQAAHMVFEQKFARGVLLPIDR